MKAKFYGLTDLSELKENLEQDFKRREQEAIEEKNRRLQEEKLSSEFKIAVKQVVPLKKSQTYIHPKRTIKLPELKKQKPLLMQKDTVKGELSDTFDARHLRDDDAGTFVRKGVAWSLLKQLQTKFWPIDLRLDLHGKSVEESRIAISALLYRAISLKARVVLIIHGQGYGAQSGESVLKFNVKNWLVQNNDVLAFCAAPSDEGGKGATLVLLRVFNEHE